MTILILRFSNSKALIQRDKCLFSRFWEGDAIKLSDDRTGSGWEGVIISNMNLVVTNSKCDQHFLCSNHVKLNFVGLLNNVIFNHCKSVIATSIVRRLTIINVSNILKKSLRLKICVKRIIQRIRTALFPYFQKSVTILCLIPPLNIYLNIYVLWR